MSLSLSGNPLLAKILHRVFHALLARLLLQVPLVIHSFILGRDYRVYLWLVPWFFFFLLVHYGVLLINLDLIGAVHVLGRLNEIFPSGCLGIVDLDSFVVPLRLRADTILIFNDFSQDLPLLSIGHPWCLRPPEVIVLLLWFVKELVHFEAGLGPVLQLPKEGGLLILGVVERWLARQIITLQLLSCALVITSVLHYLILINFYAFLEISACVVIHRFLLGGLIQGNLTLIGLKVIFLAEVYISLVHSLELFVSV